MHESPIMLGDILKAVLEIQFDFSINVARNGENCPEPSLCDCGTGKRGFDVGLRAENESPVQRKDAVGYGSGNDLDNLACSGESSRRRTTHHAP